MTNYVIINGVNSNTINGLGINELPPITKPQMRVQNEEIDGRDGDITTNLGYSAYDKTITIGLFGTGYDIDDIVAFFNGEGTIVFSNEPDKYYNFKIINQIDYVALQQFKNASITFHCQPFKYPLEETPLEIEYSYLEAEGEGNITIENTASSTMQVNLLGNTSQTGTPTPSSPIPVNVVSGDNTIDSTGKNLFNIDRTLGTPSDTAGGNTTKRTFDVSTFVKGLSVNNYYNTGITIDYTFIDNGIKITTNQGGYALAFPLLLKPNTTYTISANISPIGVERLRAGYYQQDGTFISFEINYSSNNYFSFTTPSNAYYTLIHLTPSVNTEVTFTNIMLELGNTATSYEPYTSTSYTIHLGEYELCKIGNYQDRFFKNIPNTTDYKSDLEDNEWYLEKKIGKVVLDGSETWYRWTANTFYITKLTEIRNALSNYYTYNSTATGGGQLSNGEFFIHDSTNNNVVIFKNTGINDSIDSFKTWLSTHNTIVYYVLATPTYTQITGTLKDELEAVWRANSYKGTTNISQVNNDLAFNLDVTAMEEGSNEVIVNNIGNAYSKPLLALEGNGTIDIYLNDTQILKANVEDKMNIDISTLEAYNPDTSALLNRQVIGNYNSMTLQPGDNTIRMDGSLTKATITNYVRWL